MWESSVVVEWGSFAIHCRKPWPKLVQIWSSVYSWLKCHRYNSSEKHDQHMMHNVVSFFMHLEFIPHGQTFKAQYYCKVLKHQRGNIRGNDLWMNCSATAVAHSALKRSPLNICPFSWDSLSQLSGLTGQVANNNDNNNIINYNNKWLVNLCQISNIVDVSMWCRGWSEWSLIDNSLKAVIERKSLNKVSSLQPIIEEDFLMVLSRVRCSCQN